MHTRNHVSSLARTLILAGAMLFISSPAFAVAFTVHGYMLGERIQVDRFEDGNLRSVYTAKLDVSLGTVADHVDSFCVDLDNYIGVNEYPVEAVLDSSVYGAPSFYDAEAERNLTRAAFIMDRFGSDLDQFVGGEITMQHAVTGVQAAIWEGLYKGDNIATESLSAGSLAVFTEILNTETEGLSSSWIVDMNDVQDQIIANPVPEPSAALVFGLGAVIAGTYARRE